MGKRQDAVDAARLAAKEEALRTEIRAEVEEEYRNEHAIRFETQRGRLLKANRDLRSLRKEVSELREAAGIAEDLEGLSVAAPPIEKRLEDERDTSVAVFAFSDWHAGETVSAGQVNGLNEYDPEIFRERAEAVWRNGLSLVEGHRAMTHIDTLVVGLLGDMMTGFLHEDLRLTNSMTPQEELLELMEAIVQGLDLMLREGDFGRILVPCAYGNHGRGTLKPSHAAGAKTSWEVMLYRMLARHYAAEERIEFIVPEGAHVYTDILGTTVRWHHGDGFKFGGGVGGVLIPARKALARWDSMKPAHQTVVGHWHSLTWDRNLIVNGSLIGQSAYGMNVGAYEPPQQAFFLIHEEHGRTAMHPIFCEVPKLQVVKPRQAKRRPRKAA